MNVGRTSLTPGRYVIGIHFVETPYLCPMCFVSEGAQWAIRYTMCDSFLCLYFVDALFGGIVKDTHIQQTCLLLTAENVFKNTFAIFNI